jgi:hypothetical protein
MDKRAIGEACLRAADRIVVPGQWAQNAFAKDRTGAIVSQLSKDACSWCAIGAIMVEMRVHELPTSTMRIINATLEGMGRDDTGVLIAFENDIADSPEPVAALLREIGRRLIAEADDETQPEN